MEEQSVVSAAPKVSVTEPAAGPVPAPEIVAPHAAPTEIGRKNLGELSIGDSCNGVKIDFIYAATEDYIVFQSDGQIASNYYSVVPYGREATAAFHQRVSRAEVKLKGGYREQRQSLLGGALVQAFEVAAPDQIPACFKVFDDFLAEKSPVQCVFGRSGAFVVFIDREGELIGEYPNLPKELLPAMAEVQKSVQLGKTSLRDVDQCALRQILGNELAVAFGSGAAGNIAETFAGSRAFISSRVQTRNAGMYVVTSLVVAIVATAVLLLIIADKSALTWFPQVGFVAIGAMGGMAGAWISVLQRSGSLQMPDFTPRPSVILQASVRMILGIIFGALVAVAIHANIAFGSFKSLSALALIAVAAGFSERLIPDMLSNLASQGGKTGAATQDTKPAATTPAAGAAPAAATPPVT
jgi:hypothetical protein